MQHNHRNHILCVDDNEDTCEILAVAVPQVEFTVANTFAKGLDFVRRGVFDLYLLDNWLPDGSGIELCREIRRTDTNTPVVFLSAAAYSRDHEEAIAAGATAYIDKPVDLFCLETTVTGLIRQAEVKSLDAKIAEISAVRAAIRAHLAEIDARMKENAEIAIRAIDHLLRAGAYATFIGSGGARSHFERLWPEVLSELVEDQRRGFRA